MNWRPPLETRYRHFELAIATLNPRSPLWTSDSPLWTGHRYLKLAIAKVAIASSKWRSPVQSGESPVQCGDREFKVAIANSRWRIASSKWRSPVQSGNRQFKVAITSFKWWSPVQSGESLVQKYIIIPWPLMGTVIIEPWTPDIFVHFWWLKNDSCSHDIKRLAFLHRKTPNTSAWRSFIHEIPNM